MSDELRVEFRVALTGRRPTPKPKPEPGVKAERQRQDRASRRARNLALAYWIDHLIRSGEVADLAGVARMCGVSRARVSKVVGLLGMPLIEQEHTAASRTDWSLPHKCPEHGPIAGVPECVHRC